MFLVVAILATLVPLVGTRPAAATINDFHKVRRPFQSMEMGARGRLHDECLYNASVPCPTSITEYTAQAQVIDKLTNTHGTIHPWAAGAGDAIQWEVNITSSTRADIIVDDSATPSQPNAQPDPTIIELKRWIGTGAATFAATEFSLTKYVNAALGRAVILERNTELNDAGWQRRYLGPDQRDWCVWAPPIAGHVYFAPVVESPTDKCNGEDNADEHVLSAAQDFVANELEDADSSDLLEEMLIIVAATVAAVRTIISGRVSVQPSYQEANYWTCEGTYRMTVTKSATANQTLRVEWGDGTVSDYFIAQSTGLADQVEVIQASHIFPSRLGAVYVQYAYVVGGNDYSLSFTTHQASQYDTTVSGSGPPVLYPPFQFTRSNQWTSWNVVVQRNPDRDRYVVFRPDNRDPALEKLALVPRGIGPLVLTFSHMYVNAACPPTCNTIVVYAQQALFRDLSTETYPYGGQMNSASFAWCDGCKA